MPPLPGTQILLAHQRAHLLRPCGGQASLSAARRPLSNTEHNLTPIIFKSVILLVGKPADFSLAEALFASVIVNY